MNNPYPYDQSLLEIAKKELSHTYRILVTGATGFVGSRIAQVLHDAGHDVTITGRSPWRVCSDGKFLPGDITRAIDARRLCEGQQIVIHCAAATSPWGSLDHHRSVNVHGTKHLIEGCNHAAIERFVHVSSTAIFFEFRDKTVDDLTPIPTKFANAYAKTKAQAEQIVQQAIREGLNAYIVRARAVFGPGDNALLPRLIAAAKSKKLRQIGSGENVCDLTYIDNLIAGLLAAASPNRPTGVCTITNHEPVKLWTLLHRVLDLTVPNYQPNRKIPYRIALTAATISEMKHAILRKRGEPELTRYGIGLLAKNQVFHSQAASRDLGYRPVISMDEGIERTIEVIQHLAKPARSALAQVDLKLFSTGYLTVKRSLVDRSGVRARVRIHATVALIQHPRFGSILFDAGYTPEFVNATKRFPYRIYRWLSNPTTQPQWTADSWLKRHGIHPSDLKLILLSHFHADHICALKAFPSADILTLEKAWQDAKSRTGLSALRRAILPDLLPDDLGSRVHTIQEMHDPGLGPLARSHDLFGDGSIRIFELDGHATGMMGALVNTQGNRQVFLVADAAWSRADIHRGLKPTLAFSSIAANNRNALTTLQSLSRIAQDFPDIEFVCTHCRDIAEEHQLDQCLDDLDNQGK